MALRQVRDFTFSICSTVHDVVFKRFLDIDHLLSLIVTVPKRDTQKTAENTITNVSTLLLENSGKEQNYFRKRPQRGLWGMKS